MFQRYWGKASRAELRYRPIHQHGLDVAAVMETLVISQPLLARRLEARAAVAQEAPCS